MLGIIVIHPAERGLDLGDQHIEMERLLDKVVCPKCMDITISADDPVRTKR